MKPPLPKIPLGKPSWAIRRRIIIITLLWCGGMVTYLAAWGRPITLSDTVANGCLLLMASVIGSYVFGAVWEDTRLPPADGGSVEEESTYKKTVTAADQGGQE